MSLVTPFPTIDPQRYWSCIRKVPYANKKCAKDAASRLHKMVGKSMEPYRCRWCGSHHLTTKR